MSASATNPPDPRTGSEPRTAALDSAALARLAALDPDGSQGLVKKVLLTYAKSLAQLLPQLQAARTQADAAALRHVAHTLKSSSASVGALSLASLCARLESAARELPQQDHGALADQVAAEARRIAKVLAEDSGA